MEVKRTKNTIFDIDTPVILITGMVGKITTVEQIIGIKECIEKKGYTTLVVSDYKEIEEYENGYWFDTAVKEELSIEQKMITYNHYVKELEIKYNPEVILIGISKGTSTLDRNFVEDFGIMVYGLTKVIPSDCIILNVLYGEYEKSIFAILNEEIRGVVNGEIDFFNIVNKVVDEDDSNMRKKVSLISVREEMLHEKIKELDLSNVHETITEKGVDKLVDSVINRLSEYAEVISL